MNYVTQICKSYKFIACKRYFKERDFPCKSHEYDSLPMRRITTSYANQFKSPKLRMREIFTYLFILEQLFNFDWNPAKLGGWSCRNVNSYITVYYNLLKRFYSQNQVKKSHSPTTSLRSYLCLGESYVLKYEWRVDTQTLTVVELILQDLPREKSSKQNLVLVKS